MPVTDPRDPKIDRWLRSMEPRQELVVRLAMRQCFADARADQKFNARIDELRQQFNDEDKLALILQDANMVATDRQGTRGNAARQQQVGADQGKAATAREVTMCGRYKLEVPFREIVRLYNLTQMQPDTSRFDNMPARYNIAPTQDVAVIRLDRAKQREFVMLRWGLIPYWAKDMKIAFSSINAMAETLATKPAFRDAFAQRRCLVLADGFYEWAATNTKAKQPYLIRMIDQAPFAFAGLWERWRDKERDDMIESCTIVTCLPNAVSAPIHDRMPAILTKEDYAAWLGEREASPEQLRAMLKP